MSADSRLVGCGHALGGFIPLLHSLHVIPKGSAVSSLLHPELPRAELGSDTLLVGRGSFRAQSVMSFYIYIYVYIDKARQAAVVGSHIQLEQH